MFWASGLLSLKPCRLNIAHGYKYLLVRKPDQNLEVTCESGSVRLRQGVGKILVRQVQTAWLQQSVFVHCNTVTFENKAFIIKKHDNRINQQRKKMFGVVLWVV